MKKTIFIIISLISINIFGWETSYDIALPGTKSEPSRGDQVFNYLFGPDLTRNQNEKFIHNNTNNNKPMPKPDNSQNPASN